MHESDEEVFVSGEKQAVVQTMNFISLNTFNRQSSKLSRKSQEDVSWKFTALQNQHHHSSKSHTHKFTKNISFADQKWHSHDSSDQQDSVQEHESPFVDRYRDCEEVYKKRVGFGTNWIGRKQYFTSTFIDPTRIEKNNIQYYCPKSPLDPLDSAPANPCLFDSQFESGNLMCAFKVAELEYDLLLQNDINTKGNTQWFYFRIRNVPRQRNIKINIVNLRKTDSLFNYGLMPCVYSFQQAKRGGRGWFRGGKNIRYFKNDHAIQNSKRYYFTLSFSVSTSYDNDVLLVAHSYPYTPNDLNNYLDAQTKIKYKNQLLQRDTILNTVGKNKVEVLTITDSNSKVKNKPIIFIMARQHPGQTPGSFVCQGLIDYLLSRDKESEYLRKNYQIKIIPMVNPDGVVAGNYRTNLSGIDLNRRWDGGNRSKNMHEAAYIKKYLAQITKNRDVAFMLDLHGHSRKLYSFFYGNPNSSCPVEPRVFPLLCSKLGPNLIRFEDTTFTSEEFKRNTARIQLGLSYKTPNIFTYQVSFFGYIGKDKEKKHFTVQGLKQLGQILGKGIYFHEKGKELFDSFPQNKQIALYKKCITELRSNRSLITMGQRENSGSESSPEQCEVKQNEQQKLENNEDYNCSKPIPKVKIVKKLLKKQPQVKEIYKSSRQMQVLDLAQVNSAFPSNIIALIPNSYFNKYKKNPFVSCSVQTDDSPIIKIYQTCKQHETSFFNPESSLQISTSESAVAQDSLKKSTMIRSSILNRPKTSSINSESTEYIPLSMKSQRKSRETQRRDYSPAKKALSLKKNNKIQQIGSQTIISFGRPNAYNLSNLNNLKIRLQRETDILESKTIDPTFSSIQYSKGSLQHNKGTLNAKAVGLVISKNIFEHLKIRRKNGV